jgi:hypothetical protein
MWRILGIPPILGRVVDSLPLQASCAITHRQLSCSAALACCIVYSATEPPVGDVQYVAVVEVVEAMASPGIDWVLVVRSLALCAASHA